MYVCNCIYVGKRVCIFYVSMCVCVHVFIYHSVSMVAWYSVPDSFMQSESVTGDPDPICIHVRCEPDTLAIRIQNRVISCECLFLCHFLIYHYQ